MEINDDRRDEAIEKANERWDKVHSQYDRSQIKYDDWLELFERAIKNCQTPIIANWEKLYLHEETMGRYKLEKVLWRGAFKVNK